MVNVRGYRRSGSSNGSASNFNVVSERRNHRIISPMPSGFSTRTRFMSPSSKLTLPLPKDIHDYIDDFFEMTKNRDEASYFSPCSSARTFRISKN